MAVGYYCKNTHTHIYVRVSECRCIGLYVCASAAVELNTVDSCCWLPPRLPATSVATETLLNSELHSWREPPPHPCKAMYVVSRVHLGIFTPRLDRVDRRVQNNPSYYLLTISSSSLPPLRCWRPHVFEENVFVMRMLQLLYLQQNHCTRTQQLYIPDSKVTTQGQ